MAVPPRLARALGISAVCALGIAALLQARRHPGEALGGAGAGAVLLQFAAGLGAFAAGLDLALRRSARSSGALLAASGAAVFLGAVPLPEAGSAPLFSAALAAGTLSPALAGAAALCHRVPPRRYRPALVAIGATSIVALGLLPAATFDPGTSGCFDCPPNLLLVHGATDLHDAMVQGALGANALLCALLAALAAARWIRQPALARRATAVVAVGGALVAALGAAAFAHAAAVGVLDPDGTLRAMWLAQCATLVLVAAGVAGQALRARVLRGRIADLVVATLPSPERLHAALATGLGDPELAIVFPGFGDEPVDADGHPAGAPAPGSTVTEVTRGREVVALLRHRAALAHAPERLAAAARGAGPALAHASLRARLRAEVAELSASRVRVVEVADAERRRLERDLHDGAQQRLIALSVALAQVTAQGGAAARAGEEVRLALEELRALAHGIHPVSLTEAGAGAAIRELAERSRVPVRVAKLPQARCPDPVEAAVYRLVLDGVRCAARSGDGAAVVIAIEHVGTDLHAALTLPGVGRPAAERELIHAGDRIAALNGQLAVSGEAGAIHVEARLPCGS